MRLLHAESLDFLEFYDLDVPTYAILSHTWGNEEVTFKEMKKGRGKSKQGFEKIQNCAAQAKRDGIDFIWVDTCCIDKSSSAELSEAINSMYRWYKGSRVCYAYLVDVEDTCNVSEVDSPFRRSRWWTRGWTLQELIAPQEVHFFTQSWKFIGSKKENALNVLLQTITGIDGEFLNGADPRGASIAKRMMWASNRQTTRVEDVAYSLLGIFNVNMPLLYGEREKAFIRLQEEIMKGGEDQSLFVWTATQSNNIPMGSFSDETWANNLAFAEMSGALAPSPACFRYDANPGEYSSFAPESRLTSKGLQISLRLFPLDPLNDVYLAQLRTKTSGVSLEHFILLRCLLSNQRQYVRIEPDMIISRDGFYSRNPRFSNLRTRLSPLQDLYIISPPVWPFTRLSEAFLLFVTIKAEITTSSFPLHREELRAWKDDFVILEDLKAKRGDSDASIEPGEQLAIQYSLGYSPQGRFSLVIHAARSGSILFTLEFDTDILAQRCPVDGDPSRWRVAKWRETVQGTMAIGQHSFMISIKVEEVSFNHTYFLLTVEQLPK